MDPFVCPGCKRKFTRLTNLHQHLAAEKNVRCHDQYYKRSNTTNLAKRPQSANAPTHNKKRLIQNLEEVLQHSRATTQPTEPTGVSGGAVDAPESVEFPPPDDSFPPPDDDAEEEPVTTHYEPTNSQSVDPNDINVGDGLNEGIGKFRAYLSYSQQKFAEFMPSEKAAIELMSLMDTKGGSIALYEAVMDWHLRHLTGNQQKISADKLHNDLIERYGMEPVLPYEKKVKLDSEEGEVPIVCHDCEAQTVDLLSDPRLQESDYLFPSDDPEGKPPDEWEFLADIDTGRAYRETYKKLIEPRPYTDCGRRRVLCPYIFYLDSCVTGQTQNQEVEILKFTIGLLNQKARRQKWAWRELGIVYHAAKGKGAAKNIIKEADHLDAQDYVEDLEHRRHFAKQMASNLGDFGITPEKETLASCIVAQDLHRMLRVILESYKKVEDEGGIDWDLRKDERTHYLRLVPVLLFFKVDGKEADKVCLQYTNKSEKVQCLCNVCCCPTDRSHEAYRDDELKTVPMIKSLVSQSKCKELRGMSQHLAENAFHELRFGLHNQCGVHGATCLESLHSIQLGQFGYSRGCFFHQTGKDSKLSVEINNIATAMGTYLSRQSDKSLPRTTFNRGVQAGKVMGHEMTGLLLVLTLTLRCTKGRETILKLARGDQKKYFPDESAINNWIMLLEAQLQYEAWAKEEKMEVALVERVKTKMREYMNMCKLVQQRDILNVGMGHNTKNHHAQKHLADSILDFGVPENLNTFDNERHHRPDKKTAQRTQKQAAKFDVQMGKKTQECRAVAFGMAEISGRKKWHYFCDREPDEEEVIDPFEPIVGGAKWTVSKIKETGEINVVSHSKSKSKTDTWSDRHTFGHVVELLELCSDYLNEVYLHEEVRVYDANADSKKQIYRASPHKDGRPWYDWAIFDLSKPESPTVHDRIPCQIKCVVDLTALPIEAEETLERAADVYCLVEPAYRNDQAEERYRSEFWQSYLKKPSYDLNQSATHNKLVVVSLTKLKEPAIVVPDLDNPNKRAYLKLLRPTLWAGMFKGWLAAPHRRQFDRKQQQKTGQEQLLEQQNRR